MPLMEKSGVRRRWSRCWNNGRPRHELLHEVVPSQAAGPLGKDPVCWYVEGTASAARIYDAGFLGFVCVCVFFKHFSN